VKSKKLGVALSLLLLIVFAAMASLLLLEEGATNDDRRRRSGVKAPMTKQRAPVKRAKRRVDLTGLEALPEAPPMPGQRPPAQREVIEREADGAAPDEVRLLVIEGLDQPVFGALITPRTQGRRLPPKRTDRAGRARINGLEDGDELIAEVSHPRFDTPRVFGPIPAGEFVKLRFPDNPRGSIIGALRDSGGRPIADATLKLDDGRGLEFDVSPAMLAVDPVSGRFEFELAPGRYAVIVKAPGFSETDRSFVGVEAGRESELQVTFLARAKVSGRVDANIPKGGKLLFELVLETGGLKNPFTRSWSVTVGDEGNGNFRLLDLDPGRYRLRASVAGRPERKSDWASFALGAGQEHSLNLSPRPIELSLEGHVVNTQNKLIGDVEVRCFTIVTKTDERGYFALYGLPTGYQVLELKKPGYGDKQQAVHVDPRHRTRPRIVLKQYGAVSGRVVKNGAGAASARVLLVQTRPQQGQVRQGQADAEGRYTFDNVSPGSYYIKGGAGKAFDEEGQPHFDVTPGHETKVPDCPAE
jgi:hypothetical protein